MGGDNAKILLDAEDRTRSAFDSVQQRFGRLDDALGAFTSRMGAFAGALGGAALVTFAGRMIDNADAMGKAAEKAGITVEKFSALHYAAAQSEISTEQLSKAIKELNGSLVDAQDEKSESARIFAALGVSAVDAAGNLRTADAVLLDIADAFRAMPDGALKSESAVKLFGRAGTDLINLLNGGRENLTAFTKEAERLGLVIGEDTAAAADEFNDNLGRLKATFMGLANEALPPLLAAMNKLNELFGAKASKPLENASDWALGKIKDAQKEIDDLNAELASIGRGTHLSSLWGRDADEVKKDIEAARARVLEYAKVRDDALQAEQKIAASAKKVDEKRVQKALTGGDSTTRKSGNDRPLTLDQQAEKLFPDIGRQREEAQSIADGYKKIFEATRTPQEEGIAAIEAANRAFNAGLADVDLYARAIAGAFEEFQGGDETQRKIDEAISANGDAVQRIKDLYKGVAESLLTEEQQLADSYSRRTGIIMDAYYNGVIPTIEEAQTKIADLTLQHLAEMGSAEAQAALQRKQFETATWSEKVTTITGQMGKLLAGSQAHSKQMFNIGKALAIAEGLVTLPKTVMDAYAWGNKFGGPPLGAAMAAVAGAAQLVNLNAIRSASFTGGGGGGKGGGGAAGAVPISPTTGLPVEPPRAEKTGAGQSVTIIVEGNLVDLHELSRSLRPYHIQLAKDVI